MIFISTPGVVCAAGKSADELWEKVSAADSTGIKKNRIPTGKEFFAASLDMDIYEIQDLALNQIEKEILLAKEKFGSERIAVCVGSCDNGSRKSLEAHKKFLTEGSFPKDYKLQLQSSGYISKKIKDRFLISGPCLTFNTACSSSAIAIIKAAQLVESGMADAVIAGGTDLASQTALMGFDALESISKNISSPLSANRSGITLGDGAAFFIISKEPLSDFNAKFLGWGESSDAYHMTSPQPDGDGAFSSMSSALKSAGLKAEQIDYLNLHGTGTKQNDAMESKAVERIFGEYKVPVSSTKSLTGHTLGASSAIEVAICMMALKNNSFPLQNWDRIQDPQLPQLNVIDKISIQNQDKKEIKICMSNSFGFGGSNATLIFGK